MSWDFFIVKSVSENKVEKHWASIGVTARLSVTDIL